MARASVERLAGALLPGRERLEDARRRLEEGGITRSFFVCSTPRTGSTMLADLLATTFTVGLAAEHFNSRAVPVSGVRVGDYLAGCLRKAMGTDVFATKLHWDQLDTFLRLLRRLRGSRRLSDAALIEAVFPEPRYIAMTRRDKVAQAVSWWKAEVTQVWLDWDVQSGEPVFDSGEIGRRVRLAHEQDAAWDRWFAANGVTPMRVAYEDLAADPATVATAALEHIGVAVPAGLAPSPRTRRHADSVNEEWIRRYRALAGEP